jgi:N-methylhydantoinase B
MPNAIGLAGGLPGAAVRALRVAGSDVAARIERGDPLPMQLEEAGGVPEVLQPKHPRTPLATGDIWYHSWQAGAGYGDPLDRDPEAVHRDLRNLAVSPAAAADIYGVVVNDGRVDAEATEARRAELRRERLGRAPNGTSASISGRFVGDCLVVGEGRNTYCSQCGEPLGSEGPVGARGHARVLETSLEAAGPHRGQDYGDLGFRLVRRICPGCGSLFHAELAYRGDRLVAPPEALVELVGYARSAEEAEQ